MSKHDCLHCALGLALDDWIKNHPRADRDHITSSLGRLTLEVAKHFHPECVQMQVTIMGQVFDDESASDPSKLH